MNDLRHLGRELDQVARKVRTRLVRGIRREVATATKEELRIASPVDRGALQDSWVEEIPESTSQIGKIGSRSAYGLIMDMGRRRSRNEKLKAKTKRKRKGKGRGKMLGSPKAPKGMRLPAFQRLEAKGEKLIKAGVDKALR